MPNKDLPPGWGENNSKPASWVSGGKTKDIWIINKNKRKDDSSADDDNKSEIIKSKNNSAQKEVKTVSDVFTKSDEKAQEEKKYCWNCGTQLELSYDYCSECGMFQGDEVKTQERSESLNSASEKSFEKQQPYSGNDISKINQDRIRQYKKPPKVLKVSTVVLIVLLTLSLAFLSVFIILYFGGGNSNIGQAADNRLAVNASDNAKLETLVATKATEASANSETQSSSETNSNSAKTKNGYTICDKCKFVYKSNSGCPSCASNYEQMKSEVFCPNCGGGYDVGGAVHSTYCYYCDKEFRCCPDGTLHCKKCNLCAIEYLNDNQYLKMYGYCESCAKIYADVDTCKGCGIKLFFDIEQKDGYCESCVENHTCSVCGKFKYLDLLCGICSDCDQHCKSCGIRQGGDRFTNGYCASCYKKLPDNSDDNKNVPNGIYQGVNTEGKIYSCPSCGTSKVCQAPDQYCDNCGQHFYAVG